MPIISQSWSLLQTLIAFVGLYVAGVQTEQINRRLPATKPFEKKAGRWLKKLSVLYFKDFPEIVVHTYIILREGLQELYPNLATISFTVVPAICVAWSCRQES